MKKLLVLLLILFLLPVFAVPAPAEDEGGQEAGDEVSAPELEEEGDGDFEEEEDALEPAA